MPLWKVLATSNPRQISPASLERLTARVAQTFPTTLATKILLIPSFRLLTIISSLLRSDHAPTRSKPILTPLRPQHITLLGCQIRNLPESIIEN